MIDLHTRDLAEVGKPLLRGKAYTIDKLKDDLGAPPSALARIGRRAPPIEADETVKVSEPDEDREAVEDDGPH